MSTTQQLSSDELVVSRVKSRCEIIGLLVQVQGLFIESLSLLEDISMQTTLQ